MDNQNLSELSLRGIKTKLQRAGIVLMVVAAFGLVLLGKADTLLVETSRVWFNEILAPVTAFFSKPAETIASFINGFHDLVHIRRENVKLRQENAELAELRTISERLQRHNEQLERLLRYTPPPQASFVSADVIADAGNAFAQSLIAFAGEKDGVKKGHVVLTGDGVVGRIDFTGPSASRILLLTDINSRLPVKLIPGDIPAILSGDNTDYPQLVYLPRNVKVAVGDKVVTSGMAGVYPSGLPVGVIHSVSEGVVKVRPFVNRGGLEIVRIVDYGLTDVLLEKKCTDEQTP